MDDRKRKRTGEYSDRYVRRLIQKETERSISEGQSFYLSPNDSVQIEECADHSETSGINEQHLVIEDKVTH